MSDKIARNLVDHRGWNQGLVPLHIDDNVVRGKLAKSGYFRQTVGTRGMFGCGHDRLAAKSRDRVGDARIVRRHQNPPRIALTGLPVNPLDEAHPADIEQGFTRQPGGGIAGRNNNYIIF